MRARVALFGVCVCAPFALACLSVCKVYVHLSVLVFMQLTIDRGHMSIYQSAKSMYTFR